MYTHALLSFNNLLKPILFNMHYTDTAHFIQYTRTILMLVIIVHDDTAQLYASGLPHNAAGILVISLKKH